jgi:hypothetical protein
MISPCQQRWALAATILGSCMFIGSTVVNVAALVFQRSVGTPLTDAQ